MYLSYQATIIGILIGIAVWMLLYRPFFGKENDFWDCVDYFFTPFWVPGYKLDAWKSVKISTFVFIVIVCGGYGGSMIAEAIFK